MEKTSTRKCQYANPSSDGNKTAYFRGRKLRSRIVKVPAGYEGHFLSFPNMAFMQAADNSPGIIATSTGRTLPKETPTSRRVEPDDSDLEELDPEEASEPVKILESAATFDEVTIWGHDQVPAADDPFAKGVEEWIAFAESIHSRPPAEEGPKDGSSG